jgi:hypothetical protein
MSNPVLEIVRFRVKSGVSEADFLAANRPTLAYAERQPGYVRRRLARLTEGEYVDVIEWRDMDSAKRAAETFHMAPECQDLMQVLDMESVVMDHPVIVASSM